MRSLFTLFCVLIILPTFAQTTIGLVAYYPLDTSFADVTGNTANRGVPIGNPSFTCGVDESALVLGGGTDRITFLGTDANVNGEFDTEDITISLYFKPTGTDGIQYLVSKQSIDCSSENRFFIRYVPASRTINCLFSENGSKTISLLFPIENDACWQHVTVVREGNRVTLYVNGEFAQELGSTSRIDIENDGDLVLGGSNCLVSNEVNFRGFIDDFRIYSRALEPDEVAELYFSPDQIVNEDTRIFLGESVDIQLTNTCANVFTWSPFDGVMESFDKEPTITPTRAGGPFTYTVEMREGESGCTAKDSILITVVDPTNLDCNEIFLPKAFTPNGLGPTINEDFGISNPFAIPQLISFEIFDRWGNRVFLAADAFSRWDGSYKGQEVNPGVYLYKLRYVCENVQRIQAGSLTVLR